MMQMWRRQMIHRWLCQLMDISNSITRFPTHFHCHWPCQLCRDCKHWFCIKRRIVACPESCSCESSYTLGSSKDGTTIIGRCFHCFPRYKKGSVSYQERAETMLSILPSIGGGWWVSRARMKRSHQPFLSVSTFDYYSVPWYDATQELILCYM